MGDAEAEGFMRGREWTPGIALRAPAHLPECISARLHMYAKTHMCTSIPAYLRRYAYAHTHKDAGAQRHGRIREQVATSNGIAPVLGPKSHP